MLGSPKARDGGNSNQSTSAGSQMHPSPRPTPSITSASSSASRQAPSVLSFGSFGSLRGRKSKTALPEKPSSREAAREVKRGVVTVRRADIYKLWTKADPYVEIINGDTIIGRTPQCSAYDRSPVWEHSMRIHEFEAGSTVTVLIMGKRSLPFKKMLGIEDVEVARGELVLNEDIFPRRTVQEDVDIFLPVKGGGFPNRYGEEHMAAVHLSIDFEEPLSEVTKRELKRAANRTKPVLHDNESGQAAGGAVAATAASSSYASSASRRARPRTLTDEDGIMEEAEDGEQGFEQGDWNPVSMEPAQIQDRGAGVYPPPHPSRQRLVEQQYWGRAPRGLSDPRSTSAVYCTTGLLRLMRSMSCLPCWARHPSERDEDD